MQQLTTTTISGSESLIPTGVKFFESKRPFQLETGLVLDTITIAYHSYGELNADKNNVVWVCHALTANSNVSEWWSGLFGQGKVLNPDKDYIVCANILGSNYGTTGYQGIVPNDSFIPELTIRDMVNAHIILADELGIFEIKLLIGGSLGGFQALEWSVMQPSRINNLVLIASNAVQSAWAKALNETQRMALTTDPNWKLNSFTDNAPGLAAARAIALLSYRSYKSYTLKQEDDDPSNFNYKASQYQQYQGLKLSKRFSSISYYLITKAMDSHNLGRNRTGVIAALKSITSKTLIISIDSDLLFPVCEQEFLYKNISNSCLRIIRSNFGHDGFLIETTQLNLLINSWLYNNDICLPFIETKAEFNSFNYN